MKIVLEINTNEFNLENGNVIVYDKKLNQWVSTRHDIAFKEELEEIKRLRESNETLKQQVLELTKNVNDLAKVIKGVIHNEEN